MTDLKKKSEIQLKNPKFKTPPKKAVQIYNHSKNMHIKFQKDRGMGTSKIWGIEMLDEIRIP